MSHYISPEGDEFFRLIATYLNRDEQQVVRQAYVFARDQHGDARRRSGELYITHPLTVAFYLAEYGLDAVTLMAALLHDVAEDTIVSIAQIQERFGAEVAQLVDGLTKFEQATDKSSRDALSPEAVRSATLHKLFGFMTNDIRVGIVKIFDRLHNMRTIGFNSVESQRRNSRETLDVYAPLAHRLGIWAVKNELEMLSLERLHPETFHTLQQQLQQMRYRQQMDYSESSRELAAHLTSQGIQIVDIFPSRENPLTGFRGLQRNGGRADLRMDSTMRLVVLLKDIPSCYLALGYTHSLWRPIRNSFDDYIASPLDNLYQSLHTTIIHRKSRLKVHLRTPTMNTLSEIGILAKWLTIGMPLWSPEIDMREIDRHVQGIIVSIRDSINADPHDPSLAVQGVMDNVLASQIGVFTPKGDYRELPKGATPVDFAYTIHTEVGAQCRGAIVNDHSHPLNRGLEDGDRVRVLLRGNGPQRVWLDEDLGYLTTNRAKAQVRRWFRRLSDDAAIREGKQLLDDELRMLGLAHRSHTEIADLFGLARPEFLYYGLGKAELLPTVVATRILVDGWQRSPSHHVGVPVRSEEGEQFIITNAAGRQVRLCRTCMPRPGDRILGFMRSNRNLTVHKVSCHTLPSDPFSDRTLKLGWGEEGMQEVRPVKVQIDGFDRSGLLQEITGLVSQENINMPEVHAVTHDGEAVITLVMDVASPRQLVRLLHRVHALENVHSVHCVDMV